MNPSNILLLPAESRLCAEIGRKYGNILQDTSANNIQCVRTPEIVERLVDGTASFGVFGTDVLGQTCPDKSLEALGLISLKTLLLFNDRVRFCLMENPRFEGTQIGRIHTKYPNLARSCLATSGKNPVEIVSDNGDDLERIVWEEGEKSGKNYAVADIVSSGETAGKIGWEITRVLHQVEYLLCTSLSSRDRLSSYFSSSDTMTGAYGEGLFQEFLEQYINAGECEKTDMIQEFEKQIIEKYMKYVIEKPVIGRWEDPIDEKAGAGLIKREITFLRTILERIDVG